MDVKRRIEELLKFDGQDYVNGTLVTNEYMQAAMLQLAREVRDAAVAAVKDCGEGYVKDHARAIERAIKLPPSAGKDTA